MFNEGLTRRSSCRPSHVIGPNPPPLSDRIEFDPAMPLDRTVSMEPGSIRGRLNHALAGSPIIEPVYAVYDWFVLNRKIGWQSLFDLGLGRINHASLVEIERPHLKIEKTESNDGGQKRTDVHWITEIGELHECTVDGWRQEHLIKSPNDYLIMQRALEDVRFSPTDRFFDESEQSLGESGITVGQFGQFNELGYLRTPFQVVQIDFVGLERFSMDIATERPELIELLEMMGEQLLDAFRCATRTKAVQIKLWENLSIETMGPNLFRRYLVPVYNGIAEILDGTGKRLHLHYDGKLQLIADDISGLDFDGLDSLTPWPEGDMSIAEARQNWPDKFLWIHPSLSLDVLPDDEVREHISRIVQGAGSRFCLQLSEDVPPNWRRTVPLILETLRGR